jgi:Na+-transporting NADH:ubiquinone oxidoreductase subunit C
LWGEIGAVLGFDKSLEKLTGIDFIKQNETPGLGARIMDDWFREQFRGRKGPFVLVPEGTAEGENELDAITGASYTSSFVLSLVNSSVAEVNNLVGR